VHQGILDFFNMKWRRFLVSRINRWFRLLLPIQLWAGWLIFLLSAGPPNPLGVRAWELFAISHIVLAVLAGVSVFWLWVLYTKAFHFLFCEIFERCSWNPSVIPFSSDELQAMFDESIWPASGQLFRN
jgi:hypothetical protein